MRVLAFAMLFGVSTLTPTTRAVDEDWRVLFDGNSLEGWEQVGDGRFVLEDGAIRTEGGMGLLWYTQEKFGDCVIQVTYKPENSRSNSGVFIRIADKPEDAWYAVHNGYEVQICDGAGPINRTGAVYSMSPAQSQAGKPGEWNTMEITLKGNLVFVDVNGVRVTEFDPSGPIPERQRDYEPERGPRPESGYIGLQNHGDRDVVYFKEVRVRPLKDE